MRPRYAVLTRFFSEKNSHPIGSLFTRKFGSVSVDEFMHLRSYAEYDHSLFDNNVGYMKSVTLADASTALHHALFNGCGVKEIQDMIKQRGLLAVAGMAKTVSASLT